MDCDISRSAWREEGLHLKRLALFSRLAGKLASQEQEFVYKPATDFIGGNADAADVKPEVQHTLLERERPIRKFEIYFSLRIYSYRHRGFLTGGDS